MKCCAWNNVNGRGTCTTLRWRHNERDCVSNHQLHDCLLNRLLPCADQRKKNSSSLPFVQGIHRWPVNSPHKRSVTRKMLPFDDVMTSLWIRKLQTRGIHTYLHTSYVKHWVSSPGPVLSTGMPIARSYHCPSPLPPTSTPTLTHPGQFIN